MALKSATRQSEGCCCCCYFSIRLARVKHVHKSWHILAAGCWMLCPNVCAVCVCCASLCAGLLPLCPVPHLNAEVEVSTPLEHMPYLGSWIPETHSLDAACWLPLLLLLLLLPPFHIPAQPSQLSQLSGCLRVSFTPSSPPLPRATVTL